MNRSIFNTGFLFASLLWAQNSHSAAQIADHDSGDVAIIKNSRDMLLVEAQLNDQPISILIDTGAGASIVNDKSNIVTDLIENAPTENVIENGYGGTTVSKYIAHPIIITLGKDHVKLDGAAEADISTIESLLGHHIDIIVGNDALSLRRLVVNFDRRTIRICETCEFSHIKYLNVNLHTKTTIDGDVRSVDLTGDLELGAIGNVIVDTGSADDLAITNDLYRNIAPIKTGESEIISQGINGIVVNKIFVMHDVDWKGQAIGNVAVTVDTGGNYVARAGVDGVIGLAFLKRFNFEVDFPEQRLWLTPRASPPPPVPRKTAGIIGLPDGQGHLKVMFVMPNSPAESAGWKSGELLCAIDGKSIPDDYASNDFHNWGTEKPGVHTYFTMCDGTKRELIQNYFY